MTKIMASNSFGRMLKVHYNAILLPLILLLALEVYSLASSTLVNIDNGWTAEVSDVLSREGRLASPSWKGFLQLEEFFYWRPPLYFVLEAAMFAVSGFGLLQATLLSAIVIFITFSVVVSIAQKRFGPAASLVAAIAFSSNFIYLLHTIFHGRPDALVGLLNLCSTYFLLKYNDRRENRLLLLSGAFASLSFLTHEIGGLMLAALFVNLFLIHKSEMRTFLKQSLKIAGTFLIFLLPWFYYISLNFNVFLMQWQWLLGRHGNILKVLSDELVRYEWVLTTNNGAMVPWFLLMLLLVAFSIYRRDFSVIPVTILVHLLLMPFVGNKATYYFISITPLVALQAGRLTPGLKGKGLNILRLGVALAFLASIFAFLVFSTSISRQYDFPLVFDYLRVQGYGMVIAQPAFYYAFRDEMYSAYAVFNRMEGGEPLDAILAETGADYIIYDPANLDMGSPPDFKEFLAERARKVETICAIEHNLLKGDECNSNKYRIDVYRVA